jgi:bifunctional DNA-binding transcriptional regulator/antitoxin component of YhaV-PrlF toxin-antitoxin module
LRKNRQEKMGHRIKVQRVERGATKSFYVNFPAALAEAAGIEKGEEMEWLVDDRNTFVLRRIKPKKPVAKGKEA